MQKVSVSRLAATLVAGLAIGAASVPAQATSYSSLFVFGDSLSDGAGGSNVNPLAPTTGGLVPGFPYSNGRFSNGKVAVEYLADYLGLDAAHTFNYAIGGARTGLHGVFQFTGLVTQVQFFSGVTPFLGDLSGSLFTVWAGANDFRDSLSLPDPTTAFAGIFANIGGSISTLYGLGARQFLLPNMPDVGLTPEGLASGQSAAISALSFGYDQALLGFYQTLQGLLPGANFMYADTFAAQHRVLAAAPANGITNTTAGCLLTLANTLAGLDCDASFFVDNIHPTTQIHQVLAQDFLTAVPEPGDLLLTGTALLGLMAVSARRRRQAK